MQSDQNTGDPIRRWFELRGIAYVDLGEPTLRLLLEPSFDRNVGLTFYGPAEPPGLLVDVPWWFAPALREQTAVPAEGFARACADFARVVADLDKDEIWGACLDGMTVECSYTCGGETAHFAEHASCPFVEGFVSSLIRLAWDSCREPGVRKALAVCGGYVGCKMPRGRRASS